tara:strand:- start:197 stop:703 length:507 start_codon:yes stop_codon:yes gene_type:complete
MITSIGDFVGKYELSTGMYDQAKLGDYIAKYEPLYLVNLFGASLYVEFNNDLILGGGTPTENRFLYVFDPFNYDYNSEILISQGIREMLLGCIYFEYLKDLSNQVTVAGNVKPIGENSQNTSTLNTMMYGRYNDGIRSYRTIQYYMFGVKSEDYDGFNGRTKEFAYWL